MIRRPPRTTLGRSAAASDVYKRQGVYAGDGGRADGGVQEAGLSVRDAGPGGVSPGSDERSAGDPEDGVSRQGRRQNSTIQWLSAAGAAL